MKHSKKKHGWQCSKKQNPTKTFSGEQQQQHQQNDDEGIERALKNFVVRTLPRQQAKLATAEALAEAMRIANCGRSDTKRMLLPLSFLAVAVDDDVDVWMCGCG